MTTSYTNAQQQAPDSSLRGLLHILFKHQAKILSIFIVTFVTVAVSTFLTAPVYEATASLLAKIGREYMTKSEVGNTQNLMMVNQEEVINSEIQIFNNRDLIEKAITAIGVGTLYPQLASNPSPRMTPLEAAVFKFSKSLKVEGSRNRTSFSV